MQLPVRVARFVVFAAMLLLSSSILADDMQSSSPKYLPKTALDAVQLLPAPPVAGSDEAKAELDLLVAVQEKRSEGQVARCRSEQRVTMTAFTRVMGPWFTAEKLPHLDRLIKDADHDGGFFAGAAKAYFARPRPAAEDTRIQIAVENEKTFAYPSGHAVRGILFALILAELAPQQKEALIARGQEIGWDRVIAGMHHPSDIAAGRVIGTAVARALLANCSFQKDLAIARAELAEARKAPAQPAAVAP
jgi:acid phosphatase (class A)